MPSGSRRKSAELYARACRMMPGGNTRTTVFFPPHPIYARRGRGCRVTDVDGIERIDAINNFTALIHGHAHPDIMRRVADQIADGTCFGMPTESEVVLAELLCGRLPSIERIRFANSGTEAVMLAIKAARAFTGRSKIAKCEGAYHGGYDVAEVSQNATPDRWGERERPVPVPTSRGTPNGVLDDAVVLPFNEPEIGARILAEQGDRIAAVLVDPVPNRAGLVPASDAFLAMLRGATRESGALLIFDEVIALRLGYHGAQGEFRIRPDLTTLGKIIGGGFPVGAVGGRADVMAVFDPSGGAPPVPHGGTFCANPITMVAGLAAMEALTPAAVARLNALGDRLRATLNDLFGEVGVAGQVVGRGSLLRVHLTDSRLTDYRSAYIGPERAKRLHRLHALMLENNVVMAQTGLLALSTPMGESEIAAITEAFRRALLQLE